MLRKLNPMGATLLVLACACLVRVQAQDRDLMGMTPKTAIEMAGEGPRVASVKGSPVKAAASSAVTAVGDLPGLRKAPAVILLASRNSNRSCIPDDTACGYSGGELGAVRNNCAACCSSAIHREFYRYSFMNSDKILLCGSGPDRCYGSGC
jgi:hypothetical protein